MNLPRRQFLHLAAGAAALSPMSRIARAQAYPTRPVRIVVGYVAGGATDIVARLIGQWLSERVGRQFIVENRPGAGGNLGTEAVVRALPDGYTLLLVNLANAINATLYDKLNFNFIRDIAPVAGIVRVPNVMLVNPLLSAKTVPEFIAYAKANPGKINMASAGVGSQSHFAGELFKMMTGVNVVHVPYRGGAPALTDLLGGQVQVMFDALPSSIEHIRSGKLRALAVTTGTRSEVLPDISTVGDFVPGYEMSNWFGVGVPKNTPAEIVEKLDKEINAALADSKLKARLADLGGMVLVGSPSDFGRLIADESRFAQFKGQVNRGILCRGGRASVIGIGHLDPPRLDGCWKSDPNLLAARRPIVSGMATPALWRSSRRRRPPRSARRSLGGRRGSWARRQAADRPDCMTCAPL
jgi:tripartite-type tricarboxylate transporter receptor subunit TctC